MSAPRKPLTKVTSVDVRVLAGQCTNSPSCFDHAPERCALANKGSESLGSKSRITTSRVTVTQPDCPDGAAPTPLRSRPMWFVFALVGFAVIYLRWQGRVRWCQQGDLWPIAWKVNSP